MKISSMNDNTKPASDRGSARGHMGLFLATINSDPCAFTINFADGPGQQP